MGFLALLMALAAAPAGGAPQLFVAEGIECPSRAQLQSALDERFTAARLEGSERTALLELLRDSTGQLTVRLSTSTARSVTEKTLDAHVGSCAELARTIALLTESWLRDLAAAPEPPTTPDAGSPTKVVVIETKKVVPEQERFHALSLRLAGDAVVGNEIGVGGTLAVDVSLTKRFGVGAELTVLGPLSNTDSGGGTVTVQRQEAALLATYVLAAPASSRSPAVAVLLGATILRYSARAGGYSQSGNPTGIEPGLIFGLRGTLRIFKGFFVYGELDGHAVHNTLHFQVLEAAGSSATLVTQPLFWGSLSLGVGLHLL
jgi:hypothetical protein